MIIVIDGWWGSGKSTLKGILDGHPDLFVSPIQDSIVGGLAEAADRETWMKGKDFEMFRHYLGAFSNYYRIERYADWQEVVFSPDAETVIKLPFVFDFQAFDASVKRRMKQLDTWSDEAVVRIVYEEFTKFWNDYPGSDKVRHFVTMDANRTNTPELIAGMDDSFKFVYVDRSTEGIIGTRYSRKPIPGFAATSNWNSMDVGYFIRMGEVEKIERKRLQLQDLRKRFPSKFYLVPFEKLIASPGECLPELNAFLGIADHPCLAKFTYCGQTFEKSESFLGAINDDPERIFDKDEMRMLQAEIRRVREDVPSSKTKSAFAPSRLLRKASAYLEKVDL